MKLDKEQIQRTGMRRSKKRKQWQRYRHMLGGGPISARENGFRRRVAGFKLMYTNDCYHYKLLGNLINWDENLVERFLAVRPTERELYSVIYSSPLFRYNKKDADKLRGFIPDPSKEGRAKRDLSHYVYDPDRPGQWKWKYNSDPTILGEFEKLVIKEVQIRKEKMREIIKSHEQITRSQ